MIPMQEVIMSFTVVTITLETSCVSGVRPDATGERTPV